MGTHENPKLYHFQGAGNILEEIEVIDDQIKHVSSFVKDSVRASNLAFFIGSGCSTPIIPMMGETMKSVLSNPENADILLKVKEYTDKEEVADFKDIEGLLNWLQNGMSFERDKVLKNELKVLFEKIKKELITTIPRLGDDKYINSSTIDTYTQFYKFIYNSRGLESTKLSVFTTNYDLFNEFGLENNSFSYTNGFTTDLRQSFDINRFKYRLVDDTNRYKDKWQPVKKEVNLYKLHGSINWFQDEQGALYQGQESNSADDVVIYPTALKHQETVQTPYSELFREFSTTLQKPNTTLIVMGYGFPDEHINNIISQNLQNQDFNLIIFGNITENKIKEFYEKFNKRRNVHVIGGIIADDMEGHYFDVITKEYLFREDSEESGENDA